ncbi:MAG: ABC transporter permease [Actinomycetota bacterium]|nr:ABC transporter permease [Actinomycetota bacterium]
MSEPPKERVEPPAPPEPAAGETPLGAPSVAARFALYQRAGGIVTPLITAALAFAVGGLVVLVTTGKNPLGTYQAIFSGTGLKWLFPWVTGAARDQAALNLQQTLLLTVPLVLTGLAVAFAFRCGLFNIGGQGQYIVGSIVAVQVGIWFADLSRPVHILIAIVLASIAGGLWAGIAGLLRATVGAHEVITTIMLNWIALWIGSYLVGFGGPLQNPKDTSVPATAEIAEGAKLPVFWGDPVLQGLHIGFFVAIGALAVFWVILNRTTLGYEVRAVGFNAEAARYGGIGVGRSYFTAMAISGAFAGLAGSLDLLGWEFHLDLTVVQGSQIGFFGIAVALLGRNSSIGIALSALLFGALINGTSTRTLDPAVFEPELAGNLTRIIQGLVVLFVGADVLVLYLWQVRRKLRQRALPRAAGEAPT